MIYFACMTFMNRWLIIMGCTDHWSYMFHYKLGTGTRYDHQPLQCFFWYIPYTHILGSCLPLRVLMEIAIHQAPTRTSTVSV